MILDQEHYIWTIRTTIATVDGNSYSHDNSVTTEQAFWEIFNNHVDLWLNAEYTMINSDNLSQIYFRDKVVSVNLSLLVDNRVTAKRWKLSSLKEIKEFFKEGIKNEN